MTEMDELKRDLIALCKKHKIVAAAFCGGREENNQYYAYFGLPNETSNDFVLSVLNVGRMWQHSRTSLKNFINEYEV